MTARPVFLITVFVIAQVFGQLGGLMFAALLPDIMSEWSLSHSEAGWLSGVFFGAYALSVPLLVTATDRLRPKKIYVACLFVTVASHLGLAYLADGFWTGMLFRIAAGVGWAGTYMVGLRALTDELSGDTASRAVGLHAAGIGLSGAASFVVAGFVGGEFGWQAAFVVASVSSAIAIGIAVSTFPDGAKPNAGPANALFDFRPVFRNRFALSYSIAYCVHTWEMFVVRSWAVTFLTFVLISESWVPLIFVPTVVAMVMEITGTVASVAGNEAALRVGRRRWNIGVMLASMVCASIVGFAAEWDYVAAAVMCVIYNALIYADSSALTAGTIAHAEPERKGATMAVHALLGYGGGFVGPLLMGVLLDALGGETVANWGIGFLHLAVVMVIGPWSLLALRPRSDTVN